MSHKSSVAGFMHVFFSCETSLNVFTAVLQVVCSQLKITSLLGLIDRELARQTSKPGSNLSWDAMVRPVCETFYVTCVIYCVHLKTITLIVR